MADLQPCSTIFRKAKLTALDAFLLDFRVMLFDETATREAGREASICAGLR